MNRLAARYAKVALSLAGSAILLFSCGDDTAAENAAAKETLMTEYSEFLTVVMSQNGRRSYCFETPLLEGYSQAREPYREFRKGIRITTYQDDSLSTVDVILTANYAIYYENRELWEAKGNVVAEKSDGKTLYTQQLYWNAKTKKIYSNVDSKIVQNQGRDVFVGEGFESDEEFKDWRFRRMKGRMEVDVSQRDNPDSLPDEAHSDGKYARSGRSERTAPAGNPHTADRTDKNRADAPNPPAGPAHPAQHLLQKESPDGRDARPLRTGSGDSLSAKARRTRTEKRLRPEPGTADSQTPAAISDQQQFRQSLRLTEPEDAPDNVKSSSNE